MAGKIKKKTHKGLKKRIKITGTGKVRTHKANASHLLSHKSAKRRRRLRKGHTLTHGIAKTMRKVMEV